MQAEDFQDSIRPGLVAMLPRLKRFSDLLVGERREGTALLGRALSDPDMIDRMQASLRRLGRPDAAAHIAELVLGRITPRRGGR